MIQLRDGFRFALEADLQLRVLSEFGGKDFNCHAAIEPRVARFEDLSHPARPERRNNLVGPETGTGTDGHWNRAGIVRYTTRAIRTSSIETATSMTSDSSTVSIPEPHLRIASSVVWSRSGSASKGTPILSTSSLGFSTDLSREHIECHGSAVK